jgi:hypothetical protein
MSRLGRMTYIIGPYVIAMVLLFPSVMRAVTLKAVAENLFEKPFVVDEKSLRKINEIVMKRMAERHGQITLKYTVTLSNNSYFQVDNITQVCEYENPNFAKVTGIKIEVASYPDFLRPILARKPADEGEAEKLLRILDDDVPQVGISLNEKGVAYLIRGPDRDWVLNAQTDIETRLQAICVEYYGLRTVLPSFLFVLTFILFFFVCASFLKRRYLSSATKNKLTKNMSLFAYIFNFSDPLLKNWNMAIVFFVVLIPAIGSFKLGRALCSYLVPKSLFVFGEQVSTYNNLVHLREALFWTVGIALGVGIVASLIANTLSKQRRSKSDMPPEKEV